MKKSRNIAPLLLLLYLVSLGIFTFHHHDISLNTANLFTESASPGVSGYRDCSVVHLARENFNSNVLLIESAVSSLRLIGNITEEEKTGFTRYLSFTPQRAPPVVS